MKKHFSLLKLDVCYLFDHILLYKIEYKNSFNLEYLILKKQMVLSLLEIKNNCTIVNLIDTRKVKLKKSTLIIRTIGKYS